MAVCAWFLLLAIMVGHGLFAAPVNADSLSTLDLAKLTSKGLLFAFLILISWLVIVNGKPVLRAAGWRPYVAAVAGTNLILIGALIVKPHDDLSMELQLISATLMLISNAVAIFTLIHLRNSFSIVAEARQLVTNGPYRYIRHPLYVAEQIGVIGVFIQYASVEMAVIVILHFSFQIRRMLFEEALLAATFPEYSPYMARTKRVVPGVW